MKKGIGILLSGGIACSILISCSHTSSTSTNGSTSTTVEQKSTPVSNAADASAGDEGKPSDAKPTTDTNPPNQPVVPNSGESVPSKEKQSTVQTGATVETAAAPAPIPQTTPTNQPVPSASPSEMPPAKPVDAVTLSIVGNKARGVILPAQAVAIQQGDTVLDVLSRVMKGQKIQMEYSGVMATAYVKGIDNLYEFDDGPKSGWMFKVNGKVSDRSAGAYALKSGDTVEWLYTLDLGKDIGAK